MHTDIHYIDADVIVNDKKALANIKCWLTARKMNSTEKLIRQMQETSTVNFMEFEMMCNIGGIQGYPVFAWARKLSIVVAK